MNTVFFLGAGFSKEAGMPLQNEILSNIFDLTDDEILPVIKEDFHLLRNSLKSFLRSIGYRKSFGRNISLENLFCYLDISLTKGGYFRNFDEYTIRNVRENLVSLISLYFYNCQKKSPPDKRSYLDVFSNTLIEACSRFPTRNFPISIISSNWDNQLEAALYNKIQSKKKRIIIDYNIPNALSLNRKFKVLSKIEAKLLGLHNINIIKLHGSNSWLVCPRCKRMYIDYRGAISISKILSQAFCRSCYDNFVETEYILAKTRLQNSLIMPTFLKRLHDLNYEILWQKAANDIRKADWLIFIGYSLPDADFEIKNLIFSNIKRRVKVDVVLAEGDNPKINNLTSKTGSATARYKGFLGNSRGYKFHFEGAKHFLEMFSKTGIDKIWLNRLKEKQEDYFDEDMLDQMVRNDTL